jgi:hypothetical protein
MADAIRISVKGTVGQAQTALVGRGIRGVLVHRGEHGTFWDVPSPYRAQVVTWFCEAATCGDGGFPAGTLLHHG